MTASERESEQKCRDGHDAPNPDASQSVILSHALTK